MKGKLIAKNTFYQVVARLATSFIGFLITIIIARKFGVIGFGDFTKVTSYVALFYLFVDLGFNAVFLQYEKPNFKDLFYFRISISILVFAMLNLVALFLPYNHILNTGFSSGLRTGIVIFSLGIFAQSIILSSLAIFQKTINYFYYMVGTVFGAILNLLFVLIFAFLNYSIVFIFASFVLSSLFSSFLLLKLTKENILPIGFSTRFAKEIFIKSFPIGMMLIFNLVYFRADIFLLSILSSTRDVGIYGISYKFFDFLIALPLFLSNVVYPFLIKARPDNLAFLKITKKYFFIFLGLSIFVAIPFWFISPFFTLIKADFTNAIIPFRILLISLPFFFTTSLLQWVLIARGEQKYLMYVYLLATIINILLNLIFIPQFSYIASAAITVISEGLVFLLLVYKVIVNKNLPERGL